MTTAKNAWLPTILMALTAFVGGCASTPPETGTAEARYGMHFSPADFSPPTVEQAVLSNGVTLDYFAEPNIPLVTILVRIGAGSIHDPEARAGCALMTAEVLRTGGSLKTDGDTLDRMLEERGATLSIGAGREDTWLRMSVLSEDFEWGMDVINELLSEPAFPQAKLEEARGRILDDLSRRVDTPRDIARAMFPLALYGRENPWSRVETERSVNALTTDDLKAFAWQFYAPSNIKAGVAGAVSLDEAKAAAEKTFAPLESRAVATAAVAEPPVIESSRVVIVPRDSNQNVIYFGHEGIGRFDPDKFPVKVFNNVLSGGFTSRLFKEVRSNRGLAYAVYGRLGEGTARGNFFNVVMTKSESSLEALDLMLEIDKGLIEAPPTAGEMEVARQSDANSFVFFFDTPEKILTQKMTLDAFGYPEDYLDTYVQNLLAVEPGQVSEAAARHLHLDRIVVLVVGRVDEALRKRLEQIGPVTEIGDEQLRNEWL